MNKYKTVSRAFSTDDKDALIAQHKASQLIALSGKHLIPQREDDSNSSMIFNPENGMLLGEILPNGIRVAMNMSSLKICIVHSDMSVSRTIDMIEKSHKMVFEELKESLEQIGVDTGSFINKLHYELPYKANWESKVYSKPEQDSLVFNTMLRNNAQYSLDHVMKSYNNIQNIRIWPHHFDTGSLIVLDTNKNGNPTSSIGLGWAIPDSMISEPYYYLSYWREDSNINLADAEGPEGSQWSGSGWNGASLTLSELLKYNDAEKQLNAITLFFGSGIESLKKYNSTLQDYQAKK